MSWAYRVAQTAHGIPSPDAGVVLGAGRTGLVLTAGRSWTRLRYGLERPGSRGGRALIWSARIERLDEAELWSGLIRQRCAVPVDACADAGNGGDWGATSSIGWLVGLYDRRPDGGWAALTEDYGHGARRPVLVDEAGMNAWLSSRPWEALDALAAARRVSRVPLGSGEAARLTAAARMEDRRAA